MSKFTFSSQYYRSDPLDNSVWLLQSCCFCATISIYSDGGALHVFYTKRMSGYLFALLAVIQMAAFFLYSQVTEHLDIKWLVYLVYWIRNLAEAIVPLLAAAGMLLLARAGHKRLWLFPILPVLSRALYYLPDHYLYYLADDLNTGEAIAMSAIVTLVECGVIYGFVLLLYLLAKRVYTDAEKKFDSQSEANLPFFALEIPMVRSAFCIPFTYFCLQIFLEILRTVSYLVTSAGTYTIEEILTIVLSFIMHLAVLLASHTLCILYLRYAKKHYTIREDEETI